MFLDAAVTAADKVIIQRCEEMFCFMEAGPVSSFEQKNSTIHIHTHKNEIHCQASHNISINSDAGTLISKREIFQ